MAKAKSIRTATSSENIAKVISFPTKYAQQARRIDEALETIAAKLKSGEVLEAHILMMNSNGAISKVELGQSRAPGQDGRHPRP